MKMKNKRAKKENIFWIALKRYLKNSNLHGVKYFVDERKHWTERLFWLIACGISWYICLLMVSGIVMQYIERKVDVTIETNYLKWEAEFPSIHLCVTFSKAAYNYTRIITGLSNNIDKVSHWQYAGYVSAARKKPTSEELANMTELIKPTCQDLFGICTWNDEPINCCQIFLPLKTNTGHCLSFNSYHTDAPSEDPPLPRFKVNHDVKLAKLSIFINNTEYFEFARSLYLKLYMMDRIEIPLQSSGADKIVQVSWGKTMSSTVDINAIPTFNEPEVLSLAPTVRGCQIITEIEDNLYQKIYSYEGCQLETQMKNSLNICGCVSHIFPFNDKIKVCNWTELNCVKTNRAQILDTEQINCLPDCDETIIEFSQNFDNDTSLPDWSIGRFDFNMLPGPTLRYQRFISHSTLDLIVAVGSTVGLFVGASVLSIIEIPYWLFIRRENPQ